MFLKHQPYGWFKEELGLGSHIFKKRICALHDFLERSAMKPQKNVLRAEQSRRQHQCRHRVSPWKQNNNLFRMKTCNSLGSLCLQSTPLFACATWHVSFGDSMNRWTSKTTSECRPEKSGKRRKCWKEKTKADDLDFFSQPGLQWQMKVRLFVWDPLLKM